MHAERPSVVVLRVAPLTRPRVVRIDGTVYRAAGRSTPRAAATRENKRHGGAVEPKRKTVQPPQMSLAHPLVSDGHIAAWHVVQSALAGAAHAVEQFA